MTYIQTRVESQKNPFQPPQRSIEDLFLKSQLVYTEDQVKNIAELLKQQFATSLKYEDMERVIKQHVFAFLSGTAEYSYRQHLSLSLKVYTDAEQIPPKILSKLSELICIQYHKKWQTYDPWQLNLWVQSYRALLFKAICDEINLKCELSVFQCEDILVIQPCCILKSIYIPVYMYNKEKLEPISEIWLPSVQELFTNTTGQTQSTKNLTSVSTDCSGSTYKLVEQYYYKALNMQNRQDISIQSDERSKSEIANDNPQSSYNGMISESEIKDYIVYNSSESGYQKLNNMGGQALIYKAIVRGQLVAIKVPDKCNEKAQQQIQREIEINQEIKYHENIVPYIGYTYYHYQSKDVESTHKTLALVTPFLKFGSLHDTIHRKGLPSEIRALQRYNMIKLACEIAQGMKYLHELGIVHRDLNPRNVLIGDDEKAKIADFGFSAKINKDYNSDGGTLQYMAPERLNPQQGKLITDDDKKADVYSFGMLLYEALTWKIPWEKDFEHVIKSKVLEGTRPPIPDQLQASKVLVKLIDQCWQQLPIERPSFEYIVQYLEDVLSLRI
eukprot:TRINITY_DN25029_c0_g1_i3.p1 TRINITY_DN25029_c0_g1~~TRINITY_DN25029_c0_g1_i3.p1  ORF type:complete len:628 (+),score=-7.18 TRINITY_DN25029_c0_g1_i3:216-1886(+)